MVQNDNPAVIRRNNKSHNIVSKCKAKFDLKVCNYVLLIFKLNLNRFLPVYNIALAE